MPVGVVSVVFGDRCEVLRDGAALACLLRGRLRALPAGGLAVGDQVEYQQLDSRTGVVERVLERRNELARSNRERPRRRAAPGAYPRQVVLANPDQVVFVAAARNPGLDFGLMDRALALARSARLPSAICINKMDLAPEPEMRRLLEPYERLGAQVLYASAETGQGLNELHALLRDRLSFFWGGSGVGKSSLIRALTGQEVKIGRWRTDNPRGPHTTNVTRLYPLPSGGLIADTPGFDWLALDTIEDAPDAATLLLPEAAQLSAQCRFPGCTHCGEPDCAVMAAVVAGEVDRERYARFRAAIAESRPPTIPPAELLSEEEELIFRMREGNTTTWTTFRLYYLFQTERPERAGLLQTLGVPPAALQAGPPAWVLFQETPTPQFARSLGNKPYLTAKVTSERPIAELVREGDEVILRERGVVKAIGRARAVSPAADAWRLRKVLKHTPIYESHAFWSELKPPPGEALPPVHGASLALADLVRFETLPGLALSALTRQEIGVVLDFLEVGGAEDERTRE